MIARHTLVTNLSESAMSTCSIFGMASKLGGALRASVASCTQDVCAQLSLHCRGPRFLPLVARFHDNLLSLV